MQKEAHISSIEIVMPVKLGLHLRVSARFVKCIQPFRSKVRVQKGGTTADGKSVLGLLVLAASWKSKLHIVAEGEDARETIEAVKSFFRIEGAVR